ncbi:e3 sumo-protein ligase siz1 [Phtheirospermum japonicum]|uniref:E3 sumo-protein ligase siz1 n=1 Tax=Phtheirospermum japonicum TaxID=374723 RepID=A0A830B0K5_9LAMI|nr:e3 sumo-protein ligase siz1 [Phtheirospermum japonicum]
MDLVARCKDKLAHFRVKELKDVLTQLKLSKQGRKQDLVDRILAILSDEEGTWSRQQLLFHGPIHLSFNVWSYMDATDTELIVSGLSAKKNAVGKDEVAKMVDDTYRKMQGSGAADLSSKSQGISDSANIKPKEEIVDSYQTDKVRCLCGSPLQTDSMIKCEDPRCNEWQHIACVVIPEKPMDGVLPNPPETFYCEICRLKQADPKERYYSFSYVLMLSAFTFFSVRLHHKHCCCYDLRLRMLSVLYRVHGKYTSLKPILIGHTVNEFCFWTTVAHPLYPVKLNITNIPVDGSNPGLSIEKTFQLTRADRDLLSKEEYDVQAWCMLLNDKVTFRMQWPQYADLQVNGVPMRAINRPGSQMLGANGRDDGSIITQCTRDGINKISLTGCDARVFCVGVRIVKRRSVHQILSLIPKEAEGERFEDALARVRKCIGGGATTENADSDSDIEVVADFIPVNLRCPWQCPICLKNYSWEKIIIDPYFNRITSKMLSSGEDVAEIEVKPDGSWRVKAGCDRRGLGELELWHLPDGTLCNSEVESKPKLELKPTQQEIGYDTHSALKLGIKKNRNGCWEFSKPGNSPNIIPMSSSGEDASVNQDGIEYASKSVDLTAAPAGDAEVIVLSDSEDEANPLVSSGPAVSGVHFPSPQNGIVDVYYENPALGVTGGVGSRVDLYNPNDVDEFGSSMWSLPAGGQGAPNFQLFGPDADINVNGGLVDNNPLAFGGSDPSLQLFLPTRPSEASAAAQPDSSACSGGLNGVRSEDWISLKLGDGAAILVDMNDGGTEFVLICFGLSFSPCSFLGEGKLDSQILFPSRRVKV